MPAVVVPLTPSTNQTLSVALPVNGGNIALTLAVSYNTPGGYWWLSITDDTGNLLIDAVPLIGGGFPAADVLRQYQYLAVGSAYVVPASTGLPDAVAFDALGASYYLVWNDGAGYVA
jgi:hypothetical protein